MSNIEIHLAEAYKLVKAFPELKVNCKAMNVSKGKYFPAVIQFTEEYFKKYNRKKDKSLLITFVDDKGNTVPPWDLKNILYGSKYGKPPEDSLYIDGGSQWILTDMKGVLKGLRAEYSKENLED